MSARDKRSERTAADVLADLIDALHDELSYEVAQTPEALRYAQEACMVDERLGDYLEGGDWLWVEPVHHFGGLGDGE